MRGGRREVGDGGKAMSGASRAEEGSGEKKRREEGLHERYGEGGDGEEGEGMQREGR